jgi:protein-S-isoprenylcysteine O-methyltransferase Ste14
MTADSSPPPSPQPSSAPQTIVHPQTGIGVWLRRYRRYLPVPFAVVCVVWLRPVMLGGSPVLDTVTDVLGVLVCALGQWMRMWAWGSNATVGKWGVRDRGPYTLMRHPLYTGNFLIAAGLVIIFNNPWAYLLLLAPFAYLYHVITDMEEKRMHRRFGEDYRHYEGMDVPRFFPAWGNLGAAIRSTRPFGWKFAWRKEYESCCGWIAGAAALELYEGLWTRGWEGNWPYTVWWLLLLGVVGVISFVLGARKGFRRVTKAA